MKSPIDHTQIHHTNAGSEYSERSYHLVGKVRAVLACCKANREWAFFCSLTNKRQKPPSKISGILSYRISAAGSSEERVMELGQCIDSNV